MRRLSKSRGEGRNRGIRHGNCSIKMLSALPDRYGGGQRDGGSCIPNGPHSYHELCNSKERQCLQSSFEKQP